MNSKSVKCYHFVFPVENKEVKLLKSFIPITSTFVEPKQILFTMDFMDSSHIKSEVNTKHENGRLLSAADIASSSCNLTFSAKYSPLFVSSCEDELPIPKDLCTHFDTSALDGPENRII